MKVNYHTHSRYCRHAQGEVRDFAEAAFNSGLEVLGFSDHAPFPVPLFGDRYGNGMDFDELDSYLCEVQEERERYAGKMQIFSSLEIEYLPEFDEAGSENAGGVAADWESDGGAHGFAGAQSEQTQKSYYRWLLEEKKLDYLLLGAHFFYTKKGEFLNIYTIEKLDNVLDYAEAAVQALNTGYFKIFAHPDIFSMLDFSEDSRCCDIYDKASDMIIEAAKRNGTILEFNANGMRRGLFDYSGEERWQYPLLSFWKKVSEAGLPVVVGADAHVPDQVWDSYVEEAYRTLKELGITPVEKIF